MTRLYFEPIRVECDEAGPRQFIWRHHSHRVTVVRKHWIVRIDWWRQEVSRQYYQVECEYLGLYDIYRERDRWFLERLYD